MTTETIMPNAPESTATVDNASAMDQGIYEKMTAMRELTQRNQIRNPNADEPGEKAEAKADSPVVPNEPEIESSEPEVIDFAAEDQAPDEADQEETLEAADEVSEDTEANSTSDELIDFIEFAETNPNAKFKFMRNGKEVIIDAKRAASILGQGGAIHEEARQLKIERAEFDEFKREQKLQQDGLTLAMEFTVAPRLQHAYDEILKTQGYNQVFAEQLQRTQDPTHRAKIIANMQQNERYMQEQGSVVQKIKPNIEEFRRIRQQQVGELLESSRKQFKDKELKNEYVYNELRDKISKDWSNANGETVPGIKNIDLITSDETILGLIRDGLKYRDRPKAKQAGSSIAALTGRKTGASTPAGRNNDNEISRLREQAKGGDKKAADNLLMAQLTKLKTARTGR
jgi:hypothetical protein